jgi:Flp pilus assembly protein TadD
MIAVCLLAVAPYLGGLRNGFAFDDVTIAAENLRIRSIEGFRRILVTDWWDATANRTTIVYRPLAMLTFSADYAVARIGATETPPARLSDRAAVPFHVQNLFWHAAACVALFVLILELFASEPLAFATAALFAVHPVHTEAVYGIVGRAELISAFFIFVSLIVALQCVRYDLATFGRPALAGLFLFLAALSKEYAVVIPAVPLIWLYLSPNDKRKTIAGRRSFRRMLAALAGGAVVFLAVRAFVIGSLTGVTAASANFHDPNNPIATASGAARLLTPIRVFGEVLRLLFFPKTLSVDYSLAQIPLVPTLDLATFFCLLGLIAAVGAAIVLRKRAPAASFGILFFFLTWSVTSNFVIPIGTILGERLLYLPSAGACLVVASGLVGLGRLRRLPAVALTALALLLGATRTFARASDWKDNLTLFESAATATPRSYKVHYNLAIELRLAGRKTEAIDELLRALALGSSDAKVHNNLAGLLAEQGRSGEAIEHLREAIRIDPYDADSHYNLAGLLVDEGRYEEAIEHYELVVKLRPGDEGARRDLERARAGARPRP